MIVDRRWVYMSIVDSRTYEILKRFKDNKWNLEITISNNDKEPQKDQIVFNREDSIDKYIAKQHSSLIENNWMIINSETINEMENTIKLPSNWDSVKKDLTKIEISVYEKHDDSRTSQRRRNLALRHKSLLESKQEDKELENIYIPAWVFLRYTYLRYLLNMNIYKPGIQESLVVGVTDLFNTLNNLSFEQKRILDVELMKVTKKAGPLTLKECENGVDRFVNAMVKEIEDNKSIKLYGVSRKRLALVSKRKEQLE